MALWALECEKERQRCERQRWMAQMQKISVPQDLFLVSDVERRQAAQRMRPAREEPSAEEK